MDAKWLGNCLAWNWGFGFLPNLKPSTNKHTPQPLTGVLSVFWCSQKDITELLAPWVSEADALTKLHCLFSIHQGNVSPLYQMFLLEPCSNYPACCSTFWHVEGCRGLCQTPGDVVACFTRWQSSEWMTSCFRFTKHSWSPPKQLKLISLDSSLSVGPTDVNHNTLFLH